MDGPQEERTAAAGAIDDTPRSTPVAGADDTPGRRPSRAATKPR